MCFILSLLIKSDIYHHDRDVYIVKKNKLVQYRSSVCIADICNLFSEYANLRDSLFLLY